MTQVSKACVVGMVAGCLCAPGSVWAVWTAQKVVDGTGAPVPQGTTVTIFDVGTEETTEAQTDDKGRVPGAYFQRGHTYRITAPDGHVQTVTVPKAWADPKIIGASAGGTLGVVGVAAAASGGGSGGDSAPAADTSTPTSNDTSGTSGTPMDASTQPPALNEIAGTWSLYGNRTAGGGASMIQNPSVPFSTPGGATVNIGSTATMSGPYNAHTGAYMGQGTTPDGGRETFDGMFSRLSCGTLCAKGMLSYHNPDGSLARTYDATYTKN